MIINLFEWYSFTEFYINQLLVIIIWVIMIITTYVINISVICLITVSILTLNVLVTPAPVEECSAFRYCLIKAY